MESSFLAKIRRLRGKAKKLDNLRKGIFKIKEVRELVTFKLRLPKGIRKLLVFYKKLLELALSDTPLYIE